MRENPDPSGAVGKGGGRGGLRGGGGSIPSDCERGDIPTPPGVKARGFMGSWFCSECERMSVVVCRRLNLKHRDDVICVCLCDARCDTLRRNAEEATRK